MTHFQAAQWEASDSMLLLWRRKLSRFVLCRSINYINYIGHRSCGNWETEETFLVVSVVKIEVEASSWGANERKVGERVYVLINKTSRFDCTPVDNKVICFSTSSFPGPCLYLFLSCRPINEGISIRSYIFRLLSTDGQTVHGGPRESQSGRYADEINNEDKVD